MIRTRQSRLDEAIVEWRTVLEINPRDRDAQANLARVLEVQGWP